MRTLRAQTDIARVFLGGYGFIKLCYYLVGSLIRAFSCAFSCVYLCTNDGIFRLAGILTAKAKMKHNGNHSNC